MTKVQLIKEISSILKETAAFVCVKDNPEFNEHGNKNRKFHGYCISYYEEAGEVRVAAWHDAPLDFTWPINPKYVSKETLVNLHSFIAGKEIRKIMRALA